MEVNLIPERCIACGLCQVLAPTIFDYTAEGIVIFSKYPQKNQLQLTNETVEELLKAYKACPTRAIQIKKEHD